ncbi:MAG: hypothetical protein A2V88_00755 [Elusimicrobia bacterium RBG_16_66_12]|nr:MAG: hypothetical protein A2V88_00755 [Elusimicrobia bacterium RBG_16_66_12]
MEIGQRVARLRRQRGWNQSDLASASGVPQSWISRLEARRKNQRIDFANVLRLADAFGISVDFLARGRDLKMPAMDNENREYLAALHSLSPTERAFVRDFVVFLQRRGSKELRDLGT